MYHDDVGDGGQLQVTSLFKDRAASIFHRPGISRGRAAMPRQRSRRVVATSAQPARRQTALDSWALLQCQAEPGPRAQEAQGRRPQGAQGGIARMESGRGGLGYVGDVRHLRPVRPGRRAQERDRPVARAQRLWRGALHEVPGVHRDSPAFEAVRAHAGKGRESICGRFGRRGSQGSHGGTRQRHRQSVVRPSRGATSRPRAMVPSRRRANTTARAGPTHMPEGFAKSAAASSGGASATSSSSTP
mmetsp:Transcript_4485/g.11027  ORF Transcript_4485/g.11027 Transcript_4485/m.11027 type:complete len:245 (-) Transcript_4485:2416-3150(-)